MGLVTLSDTKDYLGEITTNYDTFLQSQIDFLSSVVEDYCKRKFEQATYTQEFYMDQFADVTRRRRLYTFHYPIISITSIKEITTTDGVDDETLIDAEQYRFLASAGKIERYNEFGLIENWFSCMTPGYQARTQVVYSAGYATVPLAIQNVLFELIEKRYNKKKSGIALNFGNDVQRFSVPGVMSIDFDYTLTNNERKSKYGMFLEGYSNVLDMYRSERAVNGNIKDGYVS